MVASRFGRLDGPISSLAGLIIGWGGWGGGDGVVYSGQIASQIAQCTVGSSPFVSLFGGTCRAKLFVLSDTRGRDAVKPPSIWRG